MQMERKREGAVETVALEGRLDTVSSATAQKELEENLDGVKELVLELAKLEYVSSAGLRLLVLLHKTLSARGGTMTLRNVTPAVMDVLTMTGLAEFLSIE